MCIQNITTWAAFSWTSGMILEKLSLVGRRYRLKSIQQNISVIIGSLREMPTQCLQLSLSHVLSRRVKERRNK